MPYLEASPAWTPLLRKYPLDVVRAARMGCRRDPEDLAALPGNAGVLAVTVLLWAGYAFWADLAFSREGSAAVLRNLGWMLAWWSAVLAGWSLAVRAGREMILRLAFAIASIQLLYELPWPAIGLLQGAASAYGLSPAWIVAAGAAGLLWQACCLTAIQGALAASDPRQRRWVRWASWIVALAALAGALGSRAPALVSS